MTPNLSFNADVPYAGLRPRSGPPVSLFRWAAAMRSWRDYRLTKHSVDGTWKEVKVCA
jgi:hypothetical protein